MVRRSPHVARRAATWLSIGLVALLGAVLLSAPVGASAGGHSARMQTTTTEPDQEQQPPATEAPPSTAAPTTASTASTLPTTTAPPLEDRATESEDATTRLNRVVLGLIVLAVLIAAATVYFWIRTRPDRGTSRGRSDRQSSGRRGPGEGRSGRTGAVVISADGTEQPLVDPGPAALADDAWTVQPAPQLPQRTPGGSPGPDRPPSTDAAPDPAPMPAPAGGDSWWASQAEDPAGGDEDPADRPR